MAEFSSLNGYAVKDTVARNIAKGRNQALAYSNYEAMVDALNTMDNDEFKTGQNIYIGTVGVPDLWVYTVEPVRNTFGYVSDEAIVELLKNNVTIQVGFYKLAMLEGQKVDLTKYDERITANANAITANANAISEQNKKIPNFKWILLGETSSSVVLNVDNLESYNELLLTGEATPNRVLVSTVIPIESFINSSNSSQAAYTDDKSANGFMCELEKTSENVITLYVNRTDRTAKIYAR